MPGREPADFFIHDAGQLRAFRPVGGRGPVDQAHLFPAGPPLAGGPDPEGGPAGNTAGIRAHFSVRRRPDSQSSGCHPSQGLPAMRHRTASRRARWLRLWARFWPVRVRVHI